MMIPIWSTTLIVFGLLLVSIESLPVKNQVEIQNEDQNEDQNEAEGETDILSSRVNYCLNLRYNRSELNFIPFYILLEPTKVAKKSGAEVQNILSMLENAMNEAPNGSRPKQVRFSVVGKRNFDDLNDILKQIEYQLDEKSGPNGNSGVVPVRFSLNGKR